MISRFCIVWAALFQLVPARPNILVILTDDHRYDAMGFLGHPFLKTPHLDHLFEDFPSFGFVDLLFVKPLEIFFARL